MDSLINISRSTLNLKHFTDTWAWSAELWALRGHISVLVIYSKSSSLTVVMTLSGIVWPFLLLSLCEGMNSDTISNLEIVTVT